MMMRAVLVCLLMLLASVAQAHPLAPGLLHLEEQGEGTYSVFWRTSVARTPDGDVMPVLPTHCKTTGTPRVQVKDNAAFEQHSRIECDGGLTGHELAISNIASTGINVVVRLERADGSSVHGLIDVTQPRFRVPERRTTGGIIGDYFGLGVQHLLVGLDHLLFIAGLVLLVKGGWRLVGTVTAFTVGHSVTLALATLGWIYVNPMLAEAGIALSLLLLASEVARPREGAWIRRRPWDMAVAFGLLHGLGFAGALAETGLPQGDVPAALLGFNLGIEFGQLGVVLLLLGVAALVGSGRGLAGWTARAQAFSIYVAGSLAAFWLYERLAAVVI